MNTCNVKANCKEEATYTYHDHSEGHTTLVCTKHHKAIQALDYQLAKQVVNGFRVIA